MSKRNSKKTKNNILSYLNFTTAIKLFWGTLIMTNPVIKGKKRHSRDTPETNHIQFRDSPKTLQRHSEKVQKQSKDIPGTVQRQSRDIPWTVKRQPRDSTETV